MPIIDIHEFSTGINEEGTPENWHSKGFTGSYMNATLMQIPRAVREDIGAGLFELSEQAVQKTPALIGREVQLGDEQWSVLAVISNANDEIGRNISVTRYFLTQGLGKLNDLLTYQQKNNLIFDPFDLRQFNEAHQYDTDETPSNISNLLSLVFGDDYSNFLNNPLIPANTTTTTGQRLPAVAISKLAEEKANRYEPSMLITWAYNVEGLRTPRDFLVIYPANTIIPSEETPTEQNEEHTQPEFSTDSDGENDLTQPIQATPQLLSLPPSNHNLSSPTGNIYSAEQSIQRDLDRDNSGNNNQQRRERENEIYNAIHYWMYYGLREQNSNIFQLNNFCQIASEDSTNLRNSYDANFWEQSIFQALGIDDARGVENQLGTYSDNFVRLYFLYGLILPHKFTEFLTWLSQSSGGINENSEACQNALSFSTQINQQSLRLANQNSIHSIHKKCIQGIITHLKNYQENSQTLEPIIHLLNLDTQGLWLQSCQKIREYLWNDIKNICLHNSDFKILNNDIFRELKNILTNIIQSRRGKVTKDNILGKMEYFADFLYQVPVIHLPDSNNNSENYRLTAVIYQVTTGYVPDNLWRECQFEYPYEATLKIGENPLIHLTKKITIIEFSKQLIKKQSQKTIKFLLEKPEPRFNRLVYILILLLSAIIIKIISEFPPLSNIILGKYTINLVTGLFENNDTEIDNNDSENATNTNKETAGNAIDIFNEKTGTGNALNKMVGDLNKATNIDKNKIKIAIADILQFAPDKGLDFDTKDQNLQTKLWVEAITYYQNKSSISEQLEDEKFGIIAPGDKTDKVLRCNLRGELKIPSTPDQINKCKEYNITLTPTAKKQNQTKIIPNTKETPITLTQEQWEENITSLDKVYEELSLFVPNDRGKQEQIKDTIVLLLAMGESFEDKKDNQDKWIPGIIQYQKNIINQEKAYREEKGETWISWSADGVITYDRNTYKVLQCQLADSVDINLSQRDEICRIVLDR